MHDLKVVLGNFDFYREELPKRGYLTVDITLNDLVELKKNNVVISHKLEAIVNELKQLNIDHHPQTQKKTHEQIKKLTNKKKQLIFLKKTNKSKLDQILSSFPNIVPTTDYLKIPLTMDECSKVVNNFFSKNQTTNYLEIIKKFKIVELERAGVMYGTRNVVYIGYGAQLMRALINYCLEFNINNGYYEIMPPTLLKTEHGEKTGKIPKFSDDLYFLQTKKHTTDEQLFLSPTAELQLMIHLENQLLSISNQQNYKFVAYTKCFRREAGASGMRTKGNIRLHEFHKVEIVSLTTVVNKKNVFLKMGWEIEKLITSLGLNYKTILISKKNLSFSSLRTIDYEIYFAGSKKYIEISSLSDCGDFQTRRLKIRYKNPITQKKHFFHSLNGSALAIDRLFSALLEANFDNDRIVVPKVLRKFLSFTEILLPPLSVNKKK